MIVGVQEGGTRYTPKRLVHIENGQKFGIPKENTVKFLAPLPGKIDLTIVPILGFTHTLWGYESIYEEDALSAAATQLAAWKEHPDPTMYTPQSVFKQPTFNLSEEKAPQDPNLQGNNHVPPEV
ncbi:hypothetical protein ACLOJK_006566 [Asimina triloba]